MLSSPIKWVGSKRKILPELISRLPDKITFYSEPFFGSGSLYFAIHDKVEKAHLSDFNPELMNFFQSIRRNPHRVMEFIDSFEISEDFYLKLRAVDRAENFSKIDMFLRAARFLYLNKTAFNGLWRVNSNNQFNVSWGKYKSPTIYQRDNIEEVSKSGVYPVFVK